jgi:phosphate transport system ATP-binding protein
MEQLKNNPYFETRNFSLSIDGIKILRDISVTIPENQITVIIGPSGCGKSTLLNSMNRLIDLSENLETTGSILLKGNNIFDPSLDVTELRRSVGLISQTPNPLPMSVFDNVAYGLKIHGVRDKAVMRSTVELCLNKVALWEEVKDRLDAPASALSIGQQQRLCIARALALEPEALLCDEITSALDPVSARQIESELLSLKNNYTVVFVTHILRQAKRLADYVVFIYLGEIVECGPADTFFTEPKDPRTKAYLEGVFG